MKRVWVIRLGLVLMGLAWLASGCVSVAASEEGLTWSQALRWAASPSGIPVVVGVLFSVFAEYVPGFSGLSPKWKRGVFFLACLGVPLLAALLGVVTDGWALSWAGTFWPVLVSGVMAFGSGTMAHLPSLPDAPTSRLRMIGE